MQRANSINYYLCEVRENAAETISSKLMTTSQNFFRSERSSSKNSLSFFLFIEQKDNKSLERGFEA